MKRIITALLTVSSFVFVYQVAAAGGIETATATGPTQAAACQAAITAAEMSVHQLAIAAGQYAAEVTGVKCECTSSEDLNHSVTWSCVGVADWEVPQKK